MARLSIILGSNNTASQAKFPVGIDIASGLPVEMVTQTNKFFSVSQLEIFDDMS